MDGRRGRIQTENRKTSQRAVISSSVSSASLTLSGDKLPLALQPPVKRVVVSSEVPLLGLELNLSKCFSLMFFADWVCCLHYKWLSRMHMLMHMHRHILQHSLENNFSPAAGLAEN